MKEVVPKMARRRGSDAGQSRRRCTNVSPPQRGGAVPAPLSESWAEMARQLPQGARLSGRPQSSGIIVCDSSLNLRNSLLSANENR